MVHGPAVRLVNGDLLLVSVAHRKPDNTKVQKYFEVIQSFAELHSFANFPHQMCCLPKKIELENHISPYTDLEIFFLHENCPVLPLYTSCRGFFVIPEMSKYSVVVQRKIF